MKRNQIATVTTALLLWGAQCVSALEIFHFTPNSADITQEIHAALRDAQDPEIQLVFAPGTYRFQSATIVEQELAITNHDFMPRKIVFHAHDLSSIDIQGNGSEFLFQGRVAPFVFQNCEQVTMSNLTIDWDIPFMFQGEVIDFNRKEKWRDLKPMTDGYSWQLKEDHLAFPNVDGFSYPHLGHTYSFDPTTKDVVYGERGMHSAPWRVEQRPNGVLRIHEKLRIDPTIGSIQCSMGSGDIRYAPGVYVKSSSNIQLDGVIIHHCLGMGFLFEHADTVTLKNSGVHTHDGSNRVGSSVADATHFCNCKGDILIENCRFEGMFDDATNVHGTYVAVDRVIDKNTVRIALKHKQQKGFTFAQPGDEIWLVHQPSPDRAGVRCVTSVKRIDEVFSELTFSAPVPAQLAAGDVLENKTWNPTFTMRGCSIGKHRARNIVLKTPLKTVIEHNRFISSDMASILFRGESFNWFESGQVQDVLIQNNYFSYCNHGAADQAVLYISPRTGKTFSQTDAYDRNIRFINNTIETFDNRIVIAERVDGLLFKGNTIRRTDTAAPRFPEAPVFDLSNCSNVEISDNHYEGSYHQLMEADDASRATLTMKNNHGF